MIRLAAYILPAILLLAVFFTWKGSHTDIDFNSEVRPLLNTKCMKCHGGGKASRQF